MKRCLIGLAGEDAARCTPAGWPDHGSAVDVAEGHHQRSTVDATQPATRAAVDGAAEASVKHRRHLRRVVLARDASVRHQLAGLIGRATEFEALAHSASRSEDENGRSAVVLGALPRRDEGRSHPPPGVSLAFDPALALERPGRARGDACVDELGACGVRSRPGDEVGSAANGRNPDERQQDSKGRGHGQAVVVVPRTRFLSEPRVWVPAPWEKPMDSVAVPPAQPLNVVVVDRVSEGLAMMN